MKFQAVKGMRDFYPEQMRLRNYVFDAWHILKYMEYAATPETFKKYLEDYVMKPEFEYLEAIGGMKQATILRRLAREVKFL